MARHARNRNKVPAILETKHATIESLDQEGRGVTHVDGKTIFIDGALPTWSKYSSSRINV
jgi:23S rRNA (uracil1939-C5)-methyltransferase